MRRTLRIPALAVAFLALMAGSAAAAEKPAPVVRAAISAVRHAGDGFRLSYDVYKSGFRALSLKFDVSLGDGSYRTDARLESTGIIGWLFEWRLDAVSAGSQQQAMVRPQRYHFTNHWRGRVRSVEIAYDKGVPAEVRADPPYGDDAESTVSPDMLTSSVDPMSAVTAIVLENANGQLCRPKTAVYDGRRRYDAQLTPLGSRTLKASNFAAYAGPAEGCQLSFERIAGFKPGDERMNKMSINIWLADMGMGVGKIPVRLELHTPWGIGFAHLARVRRADGTLVFGNAE